MIAYLDPGAGSEGTSTFLLVLIAVGALVLLGLTIYIAVRLARKD